MHCTQDSGFGRLATFDVQGSSLFVRINILGGKKCQRSKIKLENEIITISSLPRIW